MKPTRRSGTILATLLAAAAINGQALPDMADSRVTDIPRYDRPSGVPRQRKKNKAARAARRNNRRNR